MPYCGLENGRDLGKDEAEELSWRDIIHEVARGDVEKVI